MKKVNLSSYTAKQHSDESTLPLINIVFLLLIFFMIAGSISSSDLLTVNAPEIEKNQGGKTVITADLLINKKKQLAFNNSPISEQELINKITEDKNKNIKLKIKADKNLSANYFITLMNKLKKIGVKEMQLIIENHHAS